VGINAAPKIALIDLVGTPYVAAKRRRTFTTAVFETAKASRWERDSAYAWSAPNEKLLMSQEMNLQLL
jgi:hypothetical protein